MSPSPSDPSLSPLAAEFVAMAAYVPQPAMTIGENGAPNTERSVEGISGASAEGNARHPKQGSRQGSGDHDRRDTFQRSAGTAATGVLLLTTPPHNSRPDNPPGIGLNLDTYG
jgi:hypothetical protein